MGLLTGKSPMGKTIDLTAQTRQGIGWLKLLITTVFYCKKLPFSIRSFLYICRYTKTKKNRAFKKSGNQGI